MARPWSDVFKQNSPRTDRELVQYDGIMKTVKDFS
jgi:hypothetical protein